MSKDLFGRRASAQLGTLVVDQLRMVFKVTRTLTGEPNTLELGIYNLAAATRGTLSQPATTPLILQAGYEQTIEQIFSGDIRPGSVGHVRDGADWVTKVKCGDGERAYRTARVQTSFRAGTPIATILQALANATGLPVGNVMEKAQQGDIAGALTQAIKGYTASGSAFDALRRTLRSMGYRLSVQDGQLQVLADTETTPEQAISLAADTGMIGSPEPADDGVLKVRSLLQPGARPGRRIEIQARSVQGFYKLLTVTHHGDTHGRDWYSDLELRPL